MIRVKTLAVVLRPRDSALLVSEGRDGTEHGYARPIGGSVEPGERAEEAVRREVVEELGTELVVHGLLAVIENLFVLHGQPGHEIDFVFRGSLRDEGLYERNQLDVLDVSGLTAVWWSPRTHRSRLVPESLPALLTSDL